MNTANPDTTSAPLAAVIAPHDIGARWQGGGVVAEVRRERDGVRLDLDLADNPTMRLRLRRRDDERPAFARSDALDASHDGDGDDFDDRMNAFAKRVLGVVARNEKAVLAVLDRPVRQGGTTLEKRAAGSYQGGYGEGTGRDNQPVEKRQTPFSRDHLVKAIDARIAKHGTTYETVELILSNPCDMGCIFCPVGDLEIGARGGHYDDNEELSELRFQIAQNDRLGAKRLRISGNDPLRHPLLPDVVQAGWDHGFDKIRVVTPGLAARQDEIADMIATFKLETLEMPFYGPNDEVFTSITGVPESFTKADKAVRNLLARGVTPELHGIAISTFLPHLEETMAWIEREYGLPFHVGHYVPHQIDLRHHHLIPSYATVKPWLDRYPDVFSDSMGFPLCWFKDPLAAVPREPIRRSLSLYTLSLPYDELNGEDWRPPNETSWPEDVCSGCYMRGYPCAGVFPQYVERHGLEGFAAITGDSFR